jgi:hypothetical protein
VPQSLDHEGQVRWLYDWWELIDAWISENRPGDAKALAVSSNRQEVQDHPAQLPPLG